MLDQILLYIFLTAAGVQVVYLLMLLTGLLRKAEKAKESLPVSVVVASRNEYDNLKVLLPRLLEQEYSNFEIIVVDDQSEDETEMLKNDPAFSKVRFIRIDRTPPHIQSKKYALTIGIKQAENPIILLTDADCIPATDQWISSMASAYTGNKKIILGYSGYTAEKSFLNYFIRFETLLTGLQYLGWAGIGIPYMGVGRNLSYKKEFFTGKKGYKKFQAVVGGDDDLFVNEHATRANTSFVTGKDALVLSIPKNTWGAYWKQKLRHLSVGKLYRRRHKFLLSIFSLSQIAFWISLLILLLNNPAENELYFFGLGFLVRLVVLCIVMAAASRRLGNPYNVAGVPVLDFCYAIYYIFAGTAALFVRKIRWS